LIEEAQELTIQPRALAIHGASIRTLCHHNSGFGLWFLRVLLLSAANTLDGKAADFLEDPSPGRRNLDSVLGDGFGHRILAVSYAHCHKRELVGLAPYVLRLQAQTQSAGKFGISPLARLKVI
jgi:hypothetical protein